MNWLNRGLTILLLMKISAGFDATTEGTSNTPKVDINKTVLEVERLLGKYPELPRLERNEILSILQNITEEDNAKLKDELAGVLEEETQKMHKSSTETPKPEKEKNRSVMVVLPFQAEDSKESLEELYTRSPIVLIEEQKEIIKTTTPKPITTQAPPIVESPSFSIVEKQNKEFNPPLRIIGYRYHTTGSPLADYPTSKTYTNYQDPEQVTMTFHTQEMKTSLAWNHRDEKDKDLDIIVKENYKPEWDKEKMKPGTDFHAPGTVDNFSLEDVMIAEEEIKEPTTVKVSEISFTTEPATTQRMYITPMSLKQVITTTDKDIIDTSVTQKKKYKTKSQSKTEKVTKPPKTDNLAEVLETLPSDMKNMLNHLGLNSKSITSTTTSEKPKIAASMSLNPEIDPSSYLKFKPLPMKRQKTIPDEMQDFLASYGLLDGMRQQKQSQESPETVPESVRFLETAPQIDTDMLSENMKQTLDKLGLYENSKVKTHIFNPSNHTSVHTEEEAKKLKALLGTIKKLAALNDSDPVTPDFQKEILKQVQELDNITTSYKTSAAINEEIHKIMEKNKGKFKIPIIMKESTASGNLNKGPQPEFFDEIQLKNEVKRQENGTKSGDESENSSTTTTEPANSPDLEDAFGGGDTAPSDANPSESLPPKQPNGLYFLLDWNTFFEVGTPEDARRVNIRFQPKVGDSRNFLPVTIP